MASAYVPPGDRSTRETGAVPAAADVPESWVSLGTTATTVIVSFVTPGDVAPPLSSPSFHGFTQIGPPPTLVPLKRP